MVVKLYGQPLSSCTRRVAAALKEYNVPYELIFVAPGATKEPEHIERQPFGQIPVLDDDGFMVYESRAICQYIALRFAAQGPQPPLLPPTSDIQKYAKYAQAASIELCNFDPYASTIVLDRVYKPMYNIPQDEKRNQELLPILNQKLDAYEKILSEQKYLAGDDYTLADLYHFPYAHKLEEAGVDWLAKRPNVARWWNDISSRPSWQAVKDGA